MTNDDRAAPDSDGTILREATAGQPLIAAQEAAPPAVPVAALDDAAPGRPRRWVIGTLVYTTGALVVLFCWLLFGDFAIAIRDRSVVPVVQLMLNGFEASNLTMALLLSVIPTTITMVLGPIVSYKSDRFRSRWGRRIPFLLIPTPIATIAMIGLAFCPQIATGLQHLGSGRISHHAALLITFGILWTCFEMAVVTAGSVVGGLIADVVPRPVVGRFYGMFRAVTLIDGIIFNWYIIGHAEKHFTLIFFWIALVFGVGFTLMCLNVKEGQYPDPAETTDPNDARRGGFFAAVEIYFRECFSSPHYCWIFAAIAFSTMSMYPINAWSLLYAKQLSVNIGSWDPAGFGIGGYRFGFGGIISLTYIFSLFMAYPLGILVDRIHALRMSIITMLLYAIVCALSYLWISDGRSFGLALLAHGVLSGAFLTASASLAQALLPRAKFSQFFSASVLATQTALLLFSPLLGKILDWTGSNYRITFALSGLFASIAAMLLVYVYLRIASTGSLNRHVPPEVL